MLAAKIFVKLCRIMDALISGIQTSIARESGLAHTRLVALTAAG